MATSLHEGPTNQLDLLIWAVEASVHSSNAHCTDKTIEVAEALLHMESPTCLRDSRIPCIGMIMAHYSLGLSSINPPTSAC
uniref:Transcription factor Elf N-terminal domain-containing protein n=1 Tax=Saimiri boliviensis boliviensis TaxID=39432 RepID=A0A2K6UPA0_SAIBB